MENFNGGWRFHLGDGGFADAGFDDAGWEGKTLPHDWGVEYPVEETASTGGGGGFAVTGIGWYRKRFTLPRREGRTLLVFDGVYMGAEVYLNGERIVGRNSGYSEFAVDLTERLRPGENVLAVRVDNSLQPNSRWYTGSGIYRNVRLLTTSEIHIERNGVFAALAGLYENNGKARLQIQTWVLNESRADADLGLEQRLFDAGGAEQARSGVGLRVKAQGRSRAMVSPVIKEPHLWSPEDPYLYRLETRLFKDGEAIDTQNVRVGIRSAVFDSSRGFLLNGKPVKIQGMCVHHDGGLTGAAFYRETWERRLALLKDMGCNGIRCAHNPPAPEFLDLCDEMGFLVMDEAFDEWLLPKWKSAEYGYSAGFAYGGSRFFAEDMEEDLVTMIRRDRNHPSVVLWSVGNEIPEQSQPEGVEILKNLMDICRREDPSRLVTSALDNIASPEPDRVTEAFECALDVVGYNYTARWGIRAETLYDEDRRKFPQRRFLGSENPSAGGIRGVYEKAGDNVFRFSYDTVTLNHEFLWRYTASRDFVAGDYLWTGIDYLGESRWPLKGAPSGPIDTAGFPKDTFYYFRSLWNKADITLHIVPHWNWKGREGEFITVIGYTNCDEVSLYLNGRLVGTKGYDFPNVGSLGAWNIRAKNSRPTTHDLHLSWDVPYEPGELAAVGRKDGREVTRLSVKTTGEAVRLRALPDRERVSLHGIAHIQIEALDAAGLPVPTADTPVTVKAEGGIRLLGLDNGDPRDLSPFFSPERKLGAGKLLGVIRGIKPGPAGLRFSARNMEDAVLTFQVVE